MDKTLLISVIIGIAASVAVVSCSLPVFTETLVIGTIWLTIVSLFLAGAVGPASWRKTMSKLQTFINYDSALFPSLQFDVTKSPEENQILSNNPLPLRERLHNAGRFTLLLFIILFVTLLIVLGIVYLIGI